MSAQHIFTSPAQKEGTGSVSEMLIEQFNGEVQGTLERKSIIRSLVDTPIMIGTNTFTLKRVGGTVLAGINPSSEPQATKVQFSNKSVSVDTIVLARNDVYMLEDIQNDFDAFLPIADEQGKKFAKEFDQSFFIKLRKGADAPAPNLLDWKSGSKITMTAANDEDDPDKVVDKLLELVAQMETKDIDMDDMILFITPTLKSVLVKATHLSRLNNGGDSSVQEYELKDIAGLRVISTNNLPITVRSQAAGTGHSLNDINGNTDFDVSAAEAKTLALIGTTKSWLSASSISLTTDIFEDKKSKSKFIDTYMAWGVEFNRPDNCAVLDSF